MTSFSLSKFPNPNSPNFNPPNQFIITASAKFSGYTVVMVPSWLKKMLKHHAVDTSSTAAQGNVVVTSCGIFPGAVPVNQILLNNSCSLSI